ncbi:hypothetical protein GFM29_03750 [Rhizobium leguminosarum bv. viciae]|nr:hypothetical protein [Rhizobium leguminosarum bv. viciae]
MAKFPIEERRPIDHPTPFEPTDCFNLTRKGSTSRGEGETVSRTQKSPGRAEPLLRLSVNPPRSRRANRTRRRW